MRVEQLYKHESHQWMVIGRSTERRDEVIDTNHYLIESNGRGLLLDPGGVETFSIVAAELSKHFELANIEAIFASHQDPDVISSLPLWIQANPDIKVYIPSIWVTFIVHFGVPLENIHPIPDQGGVISIGNIELELLPAHYLHSSGNLSLYDPQAEILFSGDIGAAMMPNEDSSLFVEDFQQHIRYMEYFHRRWMPSNTAKMRWLEEIRKRKLDLLCPQHGAIFKQQDVTAFLDWFEQLELGSGWPSIESK